jgi:hypothetical protein
VNRLEERLRDAFGAAAETVQPDAVGGLRARRPMTRARRLAPLAAATAVAVIVVGAAVSVPPLLSDGHGRSSATGTGVDAMVAVPRVTGMSAKQAASVLKAAGLHASVMRQAGSSVLAGLVITQTPAAGTRWPARATVTLVLDNGPGPSPSPGPPPPIVTISSTDLAVTITIPGSWQLTPNVGSLAYDGASGWVALDTELGGYGLQYACSAAVLSPAGMEQFGLHPQIIYRSVDGQPGCLIFPSSDAVWETRRPAGPEFQTSEALVEYRQPLVGGWHFLLISADPAHLVSIVDSIQLHH